MSEVLMFDFMDPAVDDRIRAILKAADSRGQLGHIASTVGIAGGSEALRTIMNSTGELHEMDRAMIGMHLLR